MGIMGKECLHVETTTPADKVRDAVAALNDALVDAQDYGYRVTLEVKHNRKSDTTWRVECKKITKVEEC